MNEKELHALHIARQYIRLFVDQNECGEDCKSGCTCGRFGAITDLKQVDNRIAELEQ